MAFSGVTVENWFAAIARYVGSAASASMSTAVPTRRPIGAASARSVWGRTAAAGVLASAGAAPKAIAAATATTRTRIGRPSHNARNRTRWAERTTPGARGQEGRDAT